MTNREPDATTQEIALESWKEIAAYLGRQIKTAQRWEKEEGLPIHRHSHNSRSSVYAYPREIDAWRASRKLAPETQAVPAPAWRRFLTPSFAAMILLCLVMVGNGVRTVSAKQATGKQARQAWVTRPSDTPLDMSPDGRYFAFIDWRSEGDLAVRDLKDGTERRLTSHTGGAEAEGAVFSPDGRQIAYEWQQYTGQAYEAVLTVSRSGGPPRTLWSTNGRKDWMDALGWTPDGKQLLVDEDEPSQFAFLSLQDGSIHPIAKTGAERPQHAALSPDGRWIAYDALTDANKPQRDIFVMAADGSGKTALVPGPANDIQPIWSRDGSRILFQSDRTGRPQLWSIEIENGKPGKEELVTDIPAGRVFFWATHDGTLYYQTAGRGGDNIYSAEIGADQKISKPPVRAIDSFLNSNAAPRISPDGRTLSYTSRRPEGGVIVLRDLITGKERTSAKGPSGPWFPDGHSVLQVSQSPQNSTSFSRTDLNTAKQDLLFEVPGRVAGASISPDGKTIYYAQPHRLVRHDLASNHETELATFEPAVDAFYSVAASPDGKQVAYLEWPGTQSEIRVMPAEGGPSRMLFRGDSPRYNALAWAPDGSSLFVVMNAPNTPATTHESLVLWRVPLSGAAPEQTGLSMPGMAALTITPDGRRVFFKANDSTPNEVWALENYLPKGSGSR